MSLVEKVTAITEEQMMELAKTIEGELISEVSAHSRTGRAAGSIHIEKEDDTHIFVGARANFGDYRDGGMHLYYLDQGNGGSGKTIKSKRKYDRRGRKPGKLKIMNGMYTMYATSVSGYEGANIIKEVADRHR